MLQLISTSHAKKKQNWIEGKSLFPCSWLNQLSKHKSVFIVNSKYNANWVWNEYEI